jgi:hypothetical protein
MGETFAATLCVEGHFQGASVMPDVGKISDASAGDIAVSLSTFNAMASVTRRVLRESLDPVFFRVMDMGNLQVVSLNRSKSTSLAQQFTPTLQGGETVKVTRGWVSVAGRGRWAVPETSIFLDGPSGWVVVRKDKGNPASGAFLIVSPSGPNPVQETYYEWAVCSYTLDATSGRYSIADFSLGEKEWYATL